MERINGSEWVWNIVNTYDSEVRNISDRLSFEKMLLWVNTRGMVMNKEIRSDKRIKNIIGIIQSCLILILIFLIVFMFNQQVTTVAIIPLTTNTSICSIPFTNC